MKSTAVTDGALSRREELEGPGRPAAEPHAWPPSAARSLVLELCGDAPLVELVTVRQLRRKRRLKAADATAELSLDEVDVVARGRVIHRFAELEAELTSGVEARLVELRPIFEADASLIPASGSKLDAALAATTADDGSPAAEASAAGAGAEAAAADAVRAVEAERTAVEDAARVERRAERGDRRAARAAAAESAAASGTPEPPRRTGRKKDKAKDAAEGAADAATEAAPPRHGEGLVVGKTPGVLPSDNVAEAGRKVLRFHLARMIAREPGTREGTDPEELHGMRVATRRQRAAWRVFGAWFRPDRTKRYRNGLREVASPGSAPSVTSTS